MGRPKGAVDKAKRTRRTKGAEPEGVYGSSTSSKKANNQLLKAKGLRKCSRCGKVLKLDNFNIIRYRHSSPSDDTVVPVYSMVCRACEVTCIG